MKEAIAFPELFASHPLAHGSRHLLYDRRPHRLPFPGALIEKLLQILFIAIRQSLRDRLHRLASSFQQQPAQVHPRPAILATIPWLTQHLARKYLQPLPTSLQFSCRHTSRGSSHV